MYYPIIDKAIADYCRENRITHMRFAQMVGISDKSLREKRKGRRSFTLEEGLTISCITGRRLGGLVLDPITGKDIYNCEIAWGRNNGRGEKLASQGDDKAGAAERRPGSRAVRI